LLQPEYDYDLFNHSGASSLFPTGDNDRSNSAPPPQGLQSIKLASGSSSQSPVYDAGQAWNLWKSDTTTDHGNINIVVYVHILT
jgi:hypothetical protein